VVLKELVGGRVLLDSGNCKGWRWRDLMRDELRWKRTILFQKGDVVEVVIGDLSHLLLHPGNLLLQGCPSGD
jgi:hypothetical protein